MIAAAHSDVTVKRYRTLFDETPKPMYVFDLETLAFVEVNQAALRHYGYGRDEFLALTADAIRPAEEMALLLSRIRTGTETPCMTRHQKKDGSLIDVEVSVHHLFIDDRPTVLVSVNDVTEKKRAEENLQQAQLRLATSVDELQKRESDLKGLVVLGEMLQSCYTIEEACAVVSEALPNIFPHHSGRVFTIKASRDLVEPVAGWGYHCSPPGNAFEPADCWALRRGSIHQIQNGKGLRCKHVQEDVPCMLCVPMMAQGDAVGILHIVPEVDGDGEVRTIPPPIHNLAKAAADQIALALTNIRFREVLQSQSIRDPLTNLFNRRFMEESLERELHNARRNDTPLAVVMIDVDHFKKFNDTYGHRAGDKMLRELAGHMQKSVRLDDIVCRYGGEEFVLILRSTGLEDATNRIADMKNETRDLTLDTSFGLSDPVTFSAGIACFPVHGVDGEALLAAADRALYEAKQTGRNRIAVTH